MPWFRLAAIVLVLLAAGCAGPTLQDKARRVKVGMSVAEVEAIMGPPRTGYIVGSVEWSSWVSGGPGYYQSVSMRFEHGVLISEPQASPPLR